MLHHLGPNLKIWVSLYELRVRGTSKTRNGALIRLETAPGIHGYADIHPWEEWGDAPLSRQLVCLRENKGTPLVRNAVAFAKLDAAARTEKKSLWEGLTIPRCHFTAGTPDAYKIPTIEKAVADGFDRIKIKLADNETQNVQAIQQIVPALGAQAKLRLDFNGQLKPENYRKFVTAIQAHTDRIDFIEDPTPWNPSTGYGVEEGNPIPLAVDRYVTAALDTKICPSILVVKPALQEWKQIQTKVTQLKKRCVYTSYLDHPVGQLFAAWVAATDPSAADETHGLMSHTVYEPNGFSEQIRTQGPMMSPPQNLGTGIGFDELLAKRSWTLLSNGST